jgi:hypothetical protein
LGKLKKKEEDHPTLQWIRAQVEKKAKETYIEKKMIEPADRKGKKKTVVAEEEEDEDEDQDDYDENDDEKDYSCTEEEEEEEKEESKTKKTSTRGEKAKRNAGLGKT